MSKIWLEGFWKPHPGPHRPEVASIPVGAWAAVTGLSVLVLTVGFYPEPLVRFIDGGTAGFWGLGATP